MPTIRGIVSDAAVAQQQQQLTQPPLYNESDDRRPDIIIASVISIVLAILSTIGRVAARRRVRAPLQLDDYLIFVGLFSAAAVVASTFAMEAFGLGLHITRVEHPASLAQAVVASQITYAFSVIPIKLSILALYHRLFPAPRLKYACFAIAGIVVAYSSAFTIGVGLQCVPLKKIWMPTIEGTCIDATILYIVTAVVNVLTDLAILTLPIPYIWGLSLPTARKVQLIGVFLLGAVVIAFGIVRAVAVTTASTSDESWNDVNAAIWSEVEICIGVVSANLPCLRPLFFWLPSAIRGSTRGKNTSGTGPKVPFKDVAGSYANSTNKRQSAAHSAAAAFEMSRRSRIVGGGWEEMDDSLSDVEPLAEVHHHHHHHDNDASHNHDAAVGAAEEGRAKHAPSSATVHGKSPSWPLSRVTESDSGNMISEQPPHRTDDAKREHVEYEEEDEKKEGEERERERRRRQDRQLQRPRLSPSQPGSRSSIMVETTIETRFEPSPRTSG